MDLSLSYYCSLIYTGRMDNAFQRQNLAQNCVRLLFVVCFGMTGSVRAQNQNSSPLLPAGI